MERNPTLAQWQLAQELRRLRGERKFSEVVKAARTTGGSLARWETPGDRGSVPGPAAVERLLQIYGAEDQLERILALRREARQPDRWQPFDLDRSYRTYANIESQATSIEYYSSQIIPGIAQTEGYARAIINATLQPGGDADRELQVRMARQRVLQEEKRPALWLIVAEGALRQEVGPPDVMAGQVEHLMDLAQESDITLQVLAFSAGAHAAMRLPAFVVLHVSHHGLTAVYSEGQAASLFLTDPEDLEEYAVLFNRLRASALDEGRPTRKLLERIAADHRSRKE
ncbi:DNA-binding protein [Nocardiopsis sp. TSRI0078]|uniref:helix-turn-helix domain-containing protein n=1 Tax=unclassified Nocardiopsis TaxID=2649073 RepID=UPI00093DB39A|nr:helix-turn-helix transcriptional regulator [Nocardiopsis sp. TSRI0078]OKI13038.1 DNA-binding protein [Nocardiopsis sp. TSRI0078]